MMPRNKLVVCFFIFIVTGTECWSYGETEHKAINEWILEHSVGGFDFDQYTRQNLGIDGGMKVRSLWYIYLFDWLTITGYKSPQELIAQGGIEEDEPFWRCRHHFHDPLQPWDQAGYHYSGISGESSILWAQLEAGEQSSWNGGNYSWYDARDYFYKALTGTDYEQRNKDLYKTFLAVGHLMHLIQDSSCPEHVRNDSHAIGGSVYEKLVTHYHLCREKEKEQKVQGWLQNSQNYAYPFYLPVLNTGNLPDNARISIARMVDTDWYTGVNPGVTINALIGLAEYTNANFLSQGTIFSGYNYPNHISSVTKERYVITDPRDSGKTIEREYLMKIGDGDTGYRLCTTSITGAYELDLADPVKIYRVSALDDNVLEDYAGRLVPRAVSYSAQLLKHFFRGTIEISLPNDGVYAFRDSEPADPKTQGFNKVQLLVRNTTDTGERMLGGGIDLVVQYRFLTDRADPSDPSAHAMDPLTNETYKNLSPSHISDPLYIVKPYQGNTSGEVIKPGVATLLEFDLGDEEIPLWAADVRFYVVYKGRLGSEEGYVEEDAVCVGYKDISEPTPVVFSNSTDIFCYQGVWWYDLDEDDVMQALKSMYSTDFCIQHMGVHDLLDLKITFTPSGVEPSDTPFYTISKIEPGQYKRLYLLTDYNAEFHFSLPSYASWLSTATEVDIGLRNRWTYEDDMRIWWYPIFSEYRGIELWEGRTMVPQCPSCREGENCPECSLDAIDDNQYLVPVGASSMP